MKTKILKKKLKLLNIGSLSLENLWNNNLLLKKSSNLFWSLSIVLLLFSIDGFGQSDYTLVSSSADLVAGEKYIIVSGQSGSAFVLGYQSTNNRPQATSAVSITSSKINSLNVATISGDTAKPYEFTLGGSSGLWTFYDPIYSGYLAAASSSQNYLRTNATSSNWTISFSSNAAVMTCSTGSFTRNILRYNSGSSLFSCYSGGQAAVYLFKKATVLTIPSAPVINSLISGSAELRVSFTAPSSNGGATITDYKYSINGINYFSVGSTSSPFVISGLTNGTNYNVTLKAVNSVGDGTASSVVSGTPLGVSTAPTITSITPGNGQLSVAFSAPSSDGGATITDYKYSTNGVDYISVGSTSSPFIISNLTNGTNYDLTLKAVNSVGDGAPSSAVSGTPVAPTSPTITIYQSSVDAFTTTYGTASASTSFTVSGGALTDNIIITAPSGFEISTTSGTTDFGSSKSIIPTDGAVSNTTVYVRLSADAKPVNSPFSGNISLTSTGATEVTIGTVSSIVSAKNLTISGLTGVDRDYDTTTTATVTGLATLNGVVGSDAVSLSGTPSFNFSDANAGLNKSITVLGYTLSGNDAANYTVSQPTGITATVNKINQTITAITSEVTKTFGDAPYSASTTSTSGLTISYSSSNPSVATIASNGTVTIVGAGTTTITASQAGNTNYNAATNVTQNLIVGKANQTITAITSEVTKTFGEAPYSASTTSTSGLPISYSSSNPLVATVASNGTVTIVGVGNTTITASQAGNTNYNTALSVTQSLTVGKADQTIALAATDTKTTAITTYDLVINASSGLPVSYVSSNINVATISGYTVTLIGAGTTTITATQAGNANYNAAPGVSQDLTVTLAPTVLAGWDFFGQTQNTTTTFSATTYNSNLDNSSSESTMIRGSEAASSSANNSFRTVGFKNDAISISNNDYFQIALKPNTGKNISLSNIKANLAGTASFTVSPGVISQFAYSLDGITFTLIGSPITTVGTPTSLSIDVFDVTNLQNVPSGTTITLRYYASGQTSTGGWGFISSASGINGLEINGYVNSSTPTITSALTSTGTVGASYSYTTTATNTPTSYAATGLPEGLSIDTTGVISGTPTEAGTFSVTISATNSGGTATEILEITVVPTTTLHSRSCGATISAATSFIYVDNVPHADAYEFEVTYDGDVYPTVISSDHRFRLSEVSGLPLLFNATYSIRVRVDINGTVSDFGTSCDVSTPSIPVTTLHARSCGATINAATSFIYAASVVGADAYEFEVTHNEITYPTVVSNDYRFRLSEVEGLPLMFGATYSIKVRIHSNGFEGDFGSPCNVITPSIPTTTLGIQSCGATLSATTSFIYAASVVGASAYEFEVTHNNITYPTVVSNDYRFRLSEVEGLSLLFGATYSIKVRIHSNGLLGDFGSPCNVITPSIPTTILGVQSCGATLSAATSFIYAASVVGASAYEFEVTHNSITYPTVVSNDYRFRLSEVTDLPLVFGGVYNIRVRIHSNGQEVAYGDSCKVTIKDDSSSSRQEVTSEDVKSFGSSVLSAYPNPFTTAFTITPLEGETATLFYQVYDITGKMLESKSVETSEITNHTIGADYPVGMYLVIARQGATTQTFKMIKQ